MAHWESVIREAIKVNGLADGTISGMKQHIVARAEIFREGDLYVGICPDLDVSSYGETVDAARKSLQEALEAFLEECENMGTLVETK